jgi:hypothetical protein
MPLKIKRNKKVKLRKLKIKLRKPYKRVKAMAKK